VQCIRLCMSRLYFRALKKTYHFEVNLRVDRDRSFPSKMRPSLCITAAMLLASFRIATPAVPAAFAASAATAGGAAQAPALARPLLRSAVRASCRRPIRATEPRMQTQSGDDGVAPRPFLRNSVKFHGRPLFQDPQVYPAAEEHTCTLIFLHGFGSQGPGRGEFLAGNLNIPWCKVVCPIAPQRVMGQGLQSWSSVDVLLGDSIVENVPQQAWSLATLARDVAGQFATGKLRPDEVWSIVSEQVLASRQAGLAPIKGDSTDKARNVEYIRQIIRAEERAGIPPERIMLAGFSQGGCQALSCALQMHTRLAGVIALSTWYPQGEEDAVLPERIQGLPLYTVHGDADWVVPVELVWTPSDLIACSRLARLEACPCGRCVPRSPRRELLISGISLLCTRPLCISFTVAQCIGPVHSCAPCIHWHRSPGL